MNRQNRSAVHQNRRLNPKQATLLIRFSLEVNLVCIIILAYLTFDHELPLSPTLSTHPSSNGWWMQLNESASAFFSGEGQGQIQWNSRNLLTNLENKKSMMHSFWNPWICFRFVSFRFSIRKAVRWCAHPSFSAEANVGQKFAKSLERETYLSDFPRPPKAATCGKTPLCCRKIGRCWLVLGCISTDFLQKQCSSCSMF